MPNVDNRQVIFVVYAHGSGGSFLCGLLAKAANSEFDVHLSDLGDAHWARQQSSFFGFSHLENLPNPTQQIHKLKSVVEASPVRYFPALIPSHCVASVPVYLDLFPQCKVLLVTQSNDDHVCSKINGIRKFTLGLVDQSSHPDRLYGIIEYCEEQQIMTSKEVLLLYKNRFEGENFLILEALMTASAKSIIDQPGSIDPMVHDRIINFPYSLFRYLDGRKMIELLSKTLDKRFAPEEEQDLIASYEEYFNKQNRDLMTNPRKYRADTYTKAMKMLSNRK